MKRQDAIDDILAAMLEDGPHYREMLTEFFLYGLRGLTNVSNAELEESYAQWCGEEIEIEEETDA